MFDVEFPEICEFIWPNRIVRQVFSSFPFDPYGQSQNEFETKVVASSHGWCHVSRNKFENRKFDEILKLVARSAPKITKFSRWRDFNALRRSRALLLHDS